MKQKIIDLIKESLSTCDVSDALGKKAHVFNVKGKHKPKKVGEVEYLFAWGSSIWYTHRDLANVQPNKILFIDSFSCGSVALFGALMARYAFEKKEAEAVVVNGRVRDALVSSYPVWHRGFNPIVADKKEFPDYLVHWNEIKNHKLKYHGGIAVCDHNGVVIIEPGNINQDTYQRLVKIVEREKEWYDRLDTGESTFQIVCSPQGTDTGIL